MVLQPRKYRLDYLANRQSQSIQLSQQDELQENIQSSRLTDIKRYKIFKFMIKCYKQTRFFETSLDRKFNILTYLFQ